MNLKTVHYKNNLLYLAAIENNIELVNNLFKNGYPKSLKDIPPKLKRTGSEEELSKVIHSYYNATFNLITELIKQPENLPVLTHCLEHFVKQDKAKRIEVELQTIAGFSFYYGNIKAFELLCYTFGKDKLCDSKSLLWYIHQVKRNKSNTKKNKEKLCSYIENLGVDWGKADQCLIRWANMHRTIDDFQYFYQKRKKSLKGNPKKDRIIKYELKKCLEGFLFWAVDLKNNLNSPVLEYVANRKEFTRINPYEGHLIILKKCYDLSKKFGTDPLIMESYFQKLLNKHPQMLESIKKSKIKIPQLNRIIEKLKLKEELSKNLSLSLKTQNVQKI